MMAQDNPTTNINILDSTNAKPFKCAQCGDTFVSNKDLINHKSVHATENRTFTCKECQKFFTDHSEYLLHGVNYLKKSADHKCIECGILIKKLCLPLHILSHFPPKPQSCHICGVVLQNEKLKQHLKTHSAFKKKKKCEECGKEIVSSKFHIHMATHEVKEYPCQYCGKVFDSNKQLVVHRYAHNQEKTERCDICGYKTKYKYHINKHKEQHTRDKNYICDYCNTVFLSKQKLAQHVLRHVSIRCRIKKCKFHAQTEEELKGHKMKRHFYCKICREGFENMQKFRRHNDTRKHKDAEADLDD